MRSGRAVTGTALGALALVLGLPMAAADPPATTVAGVDTTVAPTTSPATTTAPATTAAPPTTATPPTPPVAPVVGLSLRSPYVSPNGDGRLDRARITVTVDVPAVLALRVHPPTGPAQRLLADAAPVGAGTHRYEWNGRLRRLDGSLTTAADGPIVVEAVVTAASGGDPVTETARLRVDTRAPVVRQRSVGPEPWSGRGLLTQSFRATDPRHPLTMWARVYDDRDRLVDETAHQRRAPDTTSLGWRPLRRGAILRPGGYGAEIVVQDAAGNIGRSPRLPFRVHRRVDTKLLSSVRGAGRRVAITIDDCYDRAAWTSMLATLDRLDAGATFFCNGRYVRQWPDLARRTVATDRVSIGSHSSDHADLTTVGYGGALYRLLGDESAWWDVARATPAPWFRPPYGAHDASVRAAAGAASFSYTVLWDVDTRDWDVQDPGAILGHVRNEARAGSIVLLHTKPQSARALPWIIADLRARGLEPVGLPELLPP